MKTLFLSCCLIFYLFYQSCIFGKESQNSIKFLITSNLQGWFDAKDLYIKNKQAGLYYLWNDIANIKKQFPQSLLIDSGDFFYGSPRSFYALGKTENIFLQYFFQLPYDVLTLGNRDLEQISVLENILNRQVAISSNLLGDFTQPYIIFNRAGKKIFITSLSYLESYFKRDGWQKYHWKQSISKIKKKIQQEKPDLVIGIFHLSLFYSKNFYTPSVEQVILEFPIWDLVIAGQAFNALPYNNKFITRIAGTPIVRAAGRAQSWLEVDVSFKNEQKEFNFDQHYSQIKTKNNFSNDFLQYLQESTSWKYQERKTKIKLCLQNSLHLALQENFTLHPKLYLKSFFLKYGEQVQRRHLFYWLPYFNQKSTALFSAYDFKKIQQNYFNKDYFFDRRVAIPTENSFFQKYKKQYTVALNSYELRENYFIVKSLLLKSDQINHTDEYIHSLWFNHLKNNAPSIYCQMFRKEEDL